MFSLGFNERLQLNANHEKQCALESAEVDCGYLVNVHWEARWDKFKIVCKTTSLHLHCSTVVFKRLMNLFI